MLAFRLGHITDTFSTSFSSRPEWLLKEFCGEIRAEISSGGVVLCESCLSQSWGKGDKQGQCIDMILCILHHQEDGTNNIGLATMRLVDFMCNTLSWTLGVINGGNVGKKGEIREVPVEHMTCVTSDKPKSRGLHIWDVSFRAVLCFTAGGGTD